MLNMFLILQKFRIRFHVFLYITDISYVSKSAQMLYFHHLRIIIC